MPSPLPPFPTESSGFVFDSLDAEAAQKLHASMRECRRLKVALTEAEEGWRDALEVAKSIQTKLKQKEEEVQFLRTLLALAPSTPATTQQQQQQQRQIQQHQQRHHAEDRCECEQLRKAVSNLK